MNAHRGRALTVAVLAIVVAACGGKAPSAAAPSAPHVSPAASLAKVGGTWSAGPTMPTSRGEVAVAVLGGRLYVAGGFAEPGGIESSAFEAFDPATESWTTLASLPEARHHAGLTAIGDLLYLTGGNAAGFAGRANLWIYDPRANKWSAGPQMPDRRSAHAAVEVGGRLYLVGGVIPSQTLRGPTWRYDPADRSWSDGLAALPTFREHLAAVAADGTIVAVGGRAGQNLAAMERYDPATDAWTALPALPTARGGLTAAVLDGAIHVIGGEGPGDPGIFDEHEILDLGTLTWSAGPPLARGRHGLGSGVIEGRLYVAAGGTSSGLSTSDKLDVFSP